MDAAVQPINGPPTSVTAKTMAESIALPCLCLLLLLQTATAYIEKRLLPNNQKCSPGNCEKGDLMDPSIADCAFQRTVHHPMSCSATNDTGGIISWVIAPDKNGLCKPVTGNHVKFTCGERSSNTRCVCSDYKIQWNRCRCQYWTENTPGQHLPGYCTARYRGGDSFVHHYVCCNNCNNTDTTCDGATYQGGSDGDYCGHCGKPLGGGLTKWYFNCHNCGIQHHCKLKCNELVSTLPGLCWKWVNCFKGCCENSSPDPLLTATDQGFCGDMVCQENETVASCPSDCCYQVNDKCLNGGECSPPCCQETSCCL